MLSYSCNFKLSRQRQNCVFVTESATSTFDHVISSYIAKTSISHFSQVQTYRFGMVNPLKLLYNAKYLFFFFLPFV